LDECKPLLAGEADEMELDEPPPPPPPRAAADSDDDDDELDDEVGQCRLTQSNPS
jgi:hypothetical protein